MNGLALGGGHSLRGARSHETAASLVTGACGGLKAHVEASNVGKGCRRTATLGTPDSSSLCLARRRVKGTLMKWPMRRCEPALSSPEGSCGGGESLTRSSGALRLAKAAAGRSTSRSA